MLPLGVWKYFGPWLPSSTGGVSIGSVSESTVSAVSVFVSTETDSPPVSVTVTVSSPSSSPQPAITIVVAVSATTSARRARRRGAIPLTLSLDVTLGRRQFPLSRRRPHPVERDLQEPLPVERGHALLVRSGEGAEPADQG